MSLGGINLKIYYIKIFSINKILVVLDEVHRRAKRGLIEKNRY